ncbi:hypothetical protein [Bauldia litoralis]|uniref:hypothetical protein n=1 Tax=Bauldia litoralis TaxID=665467 RepID=UPI001113A309|nr:hypothetical protein [Bauldia litoralis]
MRTKFPRRKPGRLTDRGALDDQGGHAKKTIGYRQRPMLIPIIRFDMNLATTTLRHVRNGNVAE